MRGLRSRILRTLQSAAQSNVLLPPPDAGSSPSCHYQGQGAADAEAEDVPAVSSGDGADKENRLPEDNPRKAKKMKVSSSPGEPRSCYRRPDLASATLFDPDLLAAFRGAVDAYVRSLEGSKRRRDDDAGFDDGEEDDAMLAGGLDPLAGFESRCPPGGERAVVLYSTSLRGVRKTFEDCACVRRLLDGLRVAFLERDVSMHAPYRDELRALLQERDGAGTSMPLPPRLFVDGRYIGGADEVVALHEQSRLRPLLRRAPRRGASEAACAVCGGAWFVVCGGCSGSHWLYDGSSVASSGAGGRVPCPGCNENGLVPCPLCS